MNLWIRSQDKTTIIRPVSISLDNLRTSILGYYCGDYYKVLGKYATKERALEVLDEIQKIFSLKIKNKSYDEADLFLKAKMLDSCYEMPKE